MTTAAPSGIGKAMKQFGRLTGQSLAAFKEEWDSLGDESKNQITAGLSGDEPTFDYTPTAAQVKAAKSRTIEVPVGIAI